mmetsp:Transcript_13756/g.20836  ORF Transcript_13756/g.20836 Transcript_13756/m.20836 type:complete len:210 (-) Transcript_13756:250-879(-)
MFRLFYRKCIRSNTSNPRYPCTQFGIAFILFRNLIIVLVLVFVAQQFFQKGIKVVAVGSSASSIDIFQGTKSKIQCIAQVFHFLWQQFLLYLKRSNGIASISIHRAQWYIHVSVLSFVSNQGRIDTTKHGCFYKGWNFDHHRIIILIVNIVNVINIVVIHIIVALMIIIGCAHELFQILRRYKQQCLSLLLLLMLMLLMLCCCCCNDNT